jgi:hypothetical protein
MVKHAAASSRLHTRQRRLQAEHPPRTRSGWIGSAPQRLWERRCSDRLLLTVRPAPQRPSHKCPSAAAALTVQWPSACARRPLSRRRTASWPPDRPTSRAPIRQFFRRSASDRPVARRGTRMDCSIRVKAAVVITCSSRGLETARRPGSTTALDAGMTQQTRPSEQQVRARAHQLRIRIVRRRVRAFD